MPPAHETPITPKTQRKYPPKIRKQNPCGEATNRTLSVTLGPLAFAWPSPWPCPCPSALLKTAKTKASANRTTTDFITSFSFGPATALKKSGRAVKRAVGERQLASGWESGLRYGRAGAGRVSSELGVLVDKLGWDYIFIGL